MRKLGIAAGMALACWSGAVYADCTARISQVQTSGVLDYDPFLASGAIGRFVVEVENGGGTACRGRLASRRAARRTSPCRDRAAGSSTAFAVHRASMYAPQALRVTA